MSLAKCSDGTGVSLTEIAYRRRNAYEQKYRQTENNWCEGCGRPATCHAHIIPQARCKQLHKTELIWDLGNFFPSCHECNQAIENPKGNAWTKLKNIMKCLDFIAIHDQELYMKFMVNVESKI